MATLRAEDIVDLVAGTLKDLGPPKFSQIAQNLTDYEIFPKWFKKERINIQSGYSIQRNLMARQSNQARFLGLFESDLSNVPDLMEQLSIPWRHATVSWSFERREALMNRNRALIFNMIKPRRADALLGLVELVENKCWALPSSTNKTEPYGIPYWIVKNATTGFNGGLPSGHTTLAGLDLSTDATTFKNYTVQYTSVTKQDCVKKIKTAFRKTEWRSPVTADEYEGSAGQRYRGYVNETTISSFEDLGEAQNENLGKDMMPYMDTIMLRGHPLVYVPKLDEDTQNPVYGICHDVFQVVGLAGDWLVEKGPQEAPLQHNTFVTHLDLSFNLLCWNRRKNFVANIA